MKKYLITSFFILSLVLNVNAQQGVVGQYFQAQIKQSGSDLQFIIKPNPSSNGGSDIVNFKFDNFDFFIRYPLADPAATFGAPVVNTVDFPGLTMAQDIFGPEAYGSEGGFRIVEWTSPFGNSTSSPVTYVAGQEYIVFTVSVTNFSSNFQFSADNINGLPYFLTLTRNTAGIGGFSDYSAQGAGGTLTTQLFYGPPANLSFVPPFSYYQKVVGEGSLITDHFRSITSGNWNAPATWESSPVADFTSGVINPATLTPDNTASVISIRNGHTVTVTANVSTDQTLVNAGGTLVVNASTLTVIGNGLTVQSSAAGTGRIGTSTGTITGNVTVERFISDAGKRAWRLLSGKSVGGSQTIFNSWQEGGAIAANKGVWMTSGSSVLPGFDGSSINGSSILIHDQTIPSWTSIPVANTNATALSAQQGYMLFVRGDRSYTPANSPTYNTTVLKATGTLNQGTQPAVTVSTTGGRTLVGNPYASPIDVDPIFLANPSLDQAMYVWDATLTGNFSVGGFRLVERNGGAYQQTPVVLGGGPFPDANSRYIHSGQAFFLKASGVAANVVIAETMKTGSVSVVNPIVNTPGDQQLFVNLMVKNNNNVISLADGIRVRFDGAYNANTSDDYVKMGNFDENISSFREGMKLIVEKRPMIVSKDTIFLRITNTAVKDYQFQIGTFDFVQTNVSAFLTDSWLNTSTPINLISGTSEINFSVTADPASADQDRFKIVFAAAGPLPVTFTNVKAQQQVKDILVEWKVSNQLNIAQYEVEKSTDGLNFSKVKTQTSIVTNTGNAAYNWLDVQAVEGDNFYRIRSVGNNGDIKISEIVKVTIGKDKQSITVYPNPVVNKLISVQFSNMEKGTYALKLINTMGQIVGNQRLMHNGGSGSFPVKLNSGVAAGAYQLEIMKPGGDKTTLTIIVSD